MAEKTFESAIKRLEEIVKLLESGDYPLEESVKLYDEGLKLSAECNKKLKNARQKVSDIEEYLKESDSDE